MPSGNDAYQRTIDILTENIQSKIHYNKYRVDNYKTYIK